MASGSSRTSSIRSKPFDLDVIRQIELPLERPRRNSLVQELALLLLGLPTFHRQDALFCRDLDFVRRETGDRQRDLVAVFAHALDVARRVILLRAGLLLRGIDEIEQAVKADGRPPKGSKVVGSPHSQILR